MKPIILTWIKEFTLRTLKLIGEFMARVIWLMLPLGVFMLLIQMRSKASGIRSISAFTNDNSEFQAIFPGYYLVSVNPNEMKEYMAKIKGNFQKWLQNNKYILCFLLALCIVLLMLIGK